MIHTYQIRDETYIVRLEATGEGVYHVWIDGEMLSVRVLPGEHDSLILDWGAGRKVVHCAASGSQRYAHVDGQTFELVIPDQRAARRKTAAAGGDLTAQMPGQVVDVLVQEGDAVEAGQTLVILEAMKMEIRVTAPTEGTIQRVLVSKSDVVERGQTLVEVRTANFS